MGRGLWTLPHKIRWGGGEGGGFGIRRPYHLRGLAKWGGVKISCLIITWKSRVLFYFSIIGKRNAPAFLHGAMMLLLGSCSCNSGVLVSKPLGGSRINLAFHHSEVNQMSTRTSWRLTGIKVNCLLTVAL